MPGLPKQPREARVILGLIPEMVKAGTGACQYLTRKN
jgi:hypothetical protein